MVGFLGTQLILLLLSVGLVGWAGVLGYPKYLWVLNQTPGLLGIKSRSMPNLRGLIAPLIGRGALPAAVHWLLIVVVILGIVITARVWRLDRNDSRSLAAGFSFCIIMTILTSYYANSYDLTLLILPILVLGPTFVQGSEISAWAQSVFVTSAAILMFTPLFWVVILRLDQCYWVTLVLPLLAWPLGQTLKVWQSCPGGGTLSA
jgi:hypothetical protein